METEQLHSGFCNRIVLFQTFAMKRFVPFSNHAVFKSCCFHNCFHISFDETFFNAGAKILTFLNGFMKTATIVGGKRDCRELHLKHFEHQI